MVASYKFEMIQKVSTLMKDFHRAVNFPMIFVCLGKLCIFYVRCEMWDVSIPKLCIQGRSCHDAIESQIQS